MIEKVIIMSGCIKGTDSVSFIWPQYYFWTLKNDHKQLKQLLDLS